MNNDLPTDLRISAQIRIAAKAGIPIFVVNKGHAKGGTIYLKINKLDGTAEVLNQIRIDGVLCWVSASEDRGFTEKEADQYLADQLRFDPDLWIIEIEDREGRHWFPEKIHHLES